MTVKVVHEMGYYRDVELTGAFRFVVDEICHRIMDGGAELEFRWVQADVATLRGYGLMPAVLVEHLAAKTARFQHIVERVT